MSAYPRSPLEKAGGMMWLPRLTDKIRLCARGELGEAYHANLGQRFDERPVRVNEMKMELDATDRTDLQTLPDMIDLDEKRIT